MDKIKKVVDVLLQKFLEEEKGNRVTNNNMMALGIQIGQAFNGQITLTPPSTDGDTNETNDKQ